ncbi:type III secretion system cytoplasmic ring protein SctQ [Trinickia dabaoshanensis]|uniref:type III secretion system cytoplasmic ring protein SctQ n=1 Tax=Trinickia dabaoshanensis TaxID=564714 RepID=UPI00130502AD|nr:type III secretion system cytoplasmic ring protein SctQ [Trinickia dabaoshanensis]
MSATALHSPRAAPAQSNASSSAAQSLTNAASLPRVAPVAAHALNRAYAWPSPFALTLEKGRYELRWDAEAQVNGPARVYPFTFGPAEGRLVLDAIGERELIGEAASDRVPAGVRAALMADALAPVIDALERMTRQTLDIGVADESVVDDVSHERAALRFRVTKIGGNWCCHGALRFADERYLGIACPQDPPQPALAADDFDDLPIALRVSIGSSVLTVGELCVIAPGDIVSIEKWSAAGAGLRCTATTPDGRMTLSGKAAGTRIVIEHIEENSVADNPQGDAAAPRRPAATPVSAVAAQAAAADKAAPPAAAAPPVLTRIDGLEVRVTFELDERSMSLRELKALKSGYVLELDQPLNQSTVHIRANGALVGHGHLIAVGNRLGIRIASFAEGKDE